MNRLKKAIVTGLGTGYLPIAPGTWGSAAVVGLFVAAAVGSGGRVHCVTGTMAIVAVLASVGCVALGRFTERAFGKKDPGQCTADEWAGQAVALLFAPLGEAASLERVLIVAGVGFVAFRAFDIIKPQPARWLERLPHGWGVLADDLAAGVYALGIVQLLRLVL